MEAIYNWLGRHFFKLNNMNVEKDEHKTLIYIKNLLYRLCRRNSTLSIIMRKELGIKFWGHDLRWNP
jgi:hypothetical protein